MKKSKFIIPSIAISSLAVITLPLVLTSCGKTIDVNCSGSDYTWESNNEVNIIEKNTYRLTGIVIPSDALKMEIRAEQEGSPFPLSPYYAEFNGKQLNGDGSSFDVSSYQGETGPFAIKFKTKSTAKIKIKFLTA